MTPNARSKKFYEGSGYIAEIVEHWSPFPKPWGKRHDLLGIFDLLVLKPGGRAVGVQATTNSNVTARLKKIAESESAKRWKELGGEIIVISWGKLGPRGGRKTWQAREIVV